MVALFWRIDNIITYRASWPLKNNVNGGKKMYPTKYINVK